MTVYVVILVVLLILLYEPHPVGIWGNGTKPIVALCGA